MKTFIEKMKLLSSKVAAEEAKLPFHFNLIDELHANENAHSRILQRILLYSRNGTHPFLESFLTDVLHIYGAHLKSPTITFNQEFIDILIEDKTSKFACIIENKINNACDQDKQLERYINVVKIHGAKTIYAVYLTADGSKQVSSCSLTEEARRELEWSKEDSGHLILASYKNDILPWLKEEVLGSCMNKEKKMIAGIEQYVDYLEGMFGMRKEQEEMNDELASFIEETFEITGTPIEEFSKISECEKLASKFLDILSRLKIEKAEKDPWKLPKEEKASWLARRLCYVFKQKDKALPFLHVWIWNNDTLVLDKWNFAGHVVAIDISCASLSKKGISVVVRHKKKDQYKKIYSSLFEETLKSHGFSFSSNWRYLKTFPEVNCEEDFQHLVKTIESIASDLLKLSKKKK